MKLTGEDVDGNNGRSIPDRVKIIAQLPPGAAMHKEPKANGKWESHIAYRATNDWSYDADTHTAIYE